MSGLGLFKHGKKPSDQLSTGSYQSAVNMEDFDISDEKTGGDSDEEFDMGDGDSITSLGSSSLALTLPIVIGGDQLLLPAQQVKKTMKLLKYACKDSATAEQVYEATITVQKLANTTYAVKHELGDRGVCEALVSLLERHKGNGDLALELVKAMSIILLSDNENKVRLAKLGGCKQVIVLIHMHQEDPILLEACCKLMIEYGNGKFARIVEEDFQREEKTRELKFRAMKKKALTGMSASAAATAKKSLEEAEAKDLADEMNQKAAAAEKRISVARSDSKSYCRWDSKMDRDTFRIEDVEQSSIWDNRLELGRCGACEALSGLLQGIVKMPAVGQFL